MVGICFFFEEPDVDVWSGHNLDAWNYAAKAAGDIDEVIVINKTHTKIVNPDIGVYKFRETAACPTLNSKAATLVTPWRTSQNAISLWDFNHDVDWYLFGPAAENIRSQGQEVFIPQASKAALHAVHIASTVMLHRFMVKSWQ